MQLIHEVPWNQLHHAYGTCEEFPLVMQRLASAEAKERSWARNWLEELLFHQGTHYPANEFAVPFLLQTAANPALPERERLFEFLNRFLAEGNPPLSSAQRDRQNQRLQKQLQYGFGESSEHWRSYRRRAVAAAWNCRDLLGDVLQHDPAPAARCWGAYLLTDLAKTGRRDGGGWTEETPTVWFTQEAGLAILKSLRQQSTADPSAAVRVSAVLGLGFLREEPDTLEYLREIYSHASDDAVRVAAAAALHVCERSAPREVTACVVNGIANDLLPGLRECAKAAYDPDDVLLVAYKNLGMPLCEVAAGDMVEPPAKPFRCVSFPRLPAWLNASLDDGLPLADLVEQSLAGARPAARGRAVRFLGHVKLQQPEIGKLLDRLIDHDDPRVAMAAAIAVRKRNPKISVKRIVSAFHEPLRSPRTSLRARAVQGLQAMWSPKKDGPIPAALPMVVEAAARETDPTVKKLMCKLFERANIEDQSPSETYRKLGLITTAWLADPEVRRHALGALRDMHDREVPVEALEPLVAILNSDDSSREFVPRKLARILSDRVLPALLETLSKEKDPEVRQSIGWALQDLGNPMRVVEAVLTAECEGRISVDGPVGRALCSMSRELPEELQERVASLVLQSLKSPGTLPADREMLADAASSLTALPELVGDVLMETALSDPEGRVRSVAANALACAQIPVEVILPRAKQVAERGDDRAIGGLLERLDLGNTPEMPELARSLLPGLESPDYWRRKKIVSALARMEAGDPEVERTVLRRLGDEHDEVRWAATKYNFHCLPNAEVCPPLLRILRDKDGPIYAWWNLKARASVDTLLLAAENLLRSPGDMLVNDVCEWLAEQGPTAAGILPQLLAVLDDPSPNSRFEKIKAVLAIDPSQTPALLRALEPLLVHELDCVRAEAAKVPPADSRI